ncbi:MAG TPA: tetratricopeptide repeat protein [Chthoniobacterales bacterium]|jgi:tetratricopeptide (TPR) repeat protein|nr:tetratricopeptide repeat protein [Chthoniobacterales bacterium]
MSIFISAARLCAIQVCEMCNKISTRGIVAAISVGLIALVWFVFGQTIKFPFINFDDPEYVYEVPEINSGVTLHNLKWAFTHWPATNWFPLKNISYMFEFQFYGFNPGLFHLTNVILHAATVVWLFFVLRQMTRSAWRSAFVAAIFAIHPLRAESVVWIEERKDVLSGLFFMLTLGAYFYYTRKPSVARYLTMSVLFAAGLLSKPMLVTTPVILLLLDYWPLGREQKTQDRGQQTTSGTRCRRLLIEKTPLFVMSAIVAFLTSRGIAPAHSAADQLPFRARLGNAFVSYVVYIWQMIWPAKLGVFYPFPQNGFSIWQPAVAVVLLLAITVIALKLRKSHPYFVVGWFWYLAMLLPVIGLIQVNLQAHADRYTYLPQIGLYLMIAWGLADLLSSWRYRTQIASAAAVVAVLACAFAARAQASYWRDSEMLWAHTIAVTKDNYFAHASLADLLMRRGRVNEAIEHSAEALRIRPGDADAQNNLGLAMLQTGDTKRAVAQLEKALQIDPGHMNAEVNLAWVLATSADDSTRNGARAVQLAEDVARRAGHPNAIVLRTLAAAYAETGRFSEAVETAQQAIEIAKATGNDGLAADLERNIAAYRMNQPIRSGP